MSIPTKDQLLSYMSSQGGSITKRELYDAFDIAGHDKVSFKVLLRDLEASGLLEREDGKTYRLADSLPSVAAIEVIDISIDGDVFAKPVEWDEDVRGAPPRIEIKPDKKGHTSLRVGERALSRLEKTDETYVAFVIKKLDAPKSRVVGMLRAVKGGYVLEPLERRAKFDYSVTQADANGAQPGQVVIGEIIPSRSELRKHARVLEAVGMLNDPRVISLIALHEVGLRYEFPEKVIEETKTMAVPPINGRTDLRDVALVTIDGADARDFDDAVFAQRENNGFKLIVAIADVSYYVRPGTALDKEAYLRGNSTYFPDRVVPMLPERLSNDLCSLRPHEDRACLAVEMVIDENGKLLKHRFMRALMKSRARLTYEQVQAAKDGNADTMTAPLMKDVIEPLYDAFKILDAARRKRGALELDLPERKIVVNEKGEMTGVKVRERLDSHKLIEEFMILANVAAAEALEAKKAPCVYRIHDRPTGDKLTTAGTFLEAFGLSMPKGGIVNPGQLNHMLEKAKTLPAGHLISEVILRAQAQAVYDPENIGHFGLALTRYAHFTSPIRRYADLLVHRSLTRAFGFGEGGLSDTETVRLDEMAAHISATERSSAEAERNSVDRFTAAYLSDKIGQDFAGRISGVTRFGLFVKLAETGADGLVPIRTLPEDYYIHDEQQHALIGRRSRRVFRLGAPVAVRIVEADPLTASTVFELVNGEAGADIPGFKAPPMRENLRHRDKDRKDGNKSRRFEKKRGGGKPPKGRGGGKRR